MNRRKGPENTKNGEVPMTASSRSRGPRGIKVETRLKYNDIEEMAVQVVERLVPRRDLEEVLPCLDLFEHLTTDPGYFRVPVGRDQSAGLAAGVCDIPDGQQARTRYIPEAGLFVIESSELAYKWMAQGHPRGRYTLWHEVGHVYLHSRELMSRTYIEHQLQVLAREGRQHQFFEDSEWQADAFAAAACAPLQLLKQMKAEDRLNPNEVARVTGLSRDSARYRIENATNRQGL